MKPVAVCTITLIQGDDECIDAVVSSHPNGCELEKFAEGIMCSIRAAIDAHKDKP